MKKIIVIFLGFLVGITIFIPKENLFYLLQKELSPNIYINTDLSSNPIKLSLTRGQLYFNNMNMVNFEEIDIFIYLFYNKILLKNVKFEIGNYRVESGKIIYSILSPLKIFIKGKGNFGLIDGFIDLKEKFIKIYILDLKNSTIKRLLKKDEKGYYYYEKF